MFAVAGRTDDPPPETRPGAGSAAPGPFLLTGSAPIGKREVHVLRGVVITTGRHSYFTVAFGFPVQSITRAVQTSRLKLPSVITQLIPPEMPQHCVHTPCAFA